MFGFKKLRRVLPMSSDNVSNSTISDNSLSVQPVIEVKNVGKCYHVYKKPIDRLKQFILPKVKKAFGFNSKLYFDEFWALSGICLSVMPGETVGVIGKNGSGKSTLLQVISGVLSPTVGSVEIRGRVAALLELGSGFNPELTGKENIYLNGSILGLSEREIDEKFQSIIDFADIGDFINQPIKTYSSGMVVRLAFAVQSQIDPEILIIDEALAVGDAKFQAKCFDRLRKLKENGTSILLVTHSSEQIVNHCDRAVLINNGELIEQGEPRYIVNRYMDILFGKSLLNQSVEMANEISHFDKSKNILSETQDVFHTRLNYNEHEYRWGDGRAQIIDFILSAIERGSCTTFSSGDKIEVIFSVRFVEELIRPIFGVTVKTKEGIVVCGSNSELLSVRELQSLGRKGSTVIIRATFKCKLTQGDYFLSLGVATKNGEEVIPHDRRYDSIHIHVAPTNSYFGLVDMDLRLACGVGEA